MKRHYEYGELFTHSLLTSYRIYGDANSPLTPLIVLHGGPSGGFDYLLNYQRLADDGRRIIFYDQYGCGRSTHLPYAAPSFWTISLFTRQLQDLIDHLGIGERFALLGHSWGGMLAAEFAVLQPKGLERIILASAPASIAAWRAEGERLLALLANENDYSDALTHSMYPDPPSLLQDYYAKHVYQLAAESTHVQRSNAQFNADPTVYYVMWGRNEIAVTGTLASWRITDRLSAIACPTMVINGEQDQATTNVVSEYVNNLTNCAWRTIPDSSHNPHEENPLYCLSAVQEFLRHKLNKNKGEQNGTC